MRFVLVLGTEFLDVFLQYSHWCRNIKPQQHQSAENRVGYNGREYSDWIDKEQLERSTVKIHQLFVLSYLCNVLKFGPKPNCLHVVYSPFCVYKLKVCFILGIWKNPTIIPFPSEEMANYVDIYNKYNICSPHWLDCRIEQNSIASLEGIISWQNSLCEFLFSRVVLTIFPLTI